MKIDLLAYRRLLGLWTFAYALMHSLYFLLLKNAGSPALIYAGMLKHPFVIFGAAALLILAIMALTSPKKLYTKFASWHKPVYFASVLIALHYMLSQKVIDLDVALYVGILAGLLALRLLKR
jgi:sulfoxide reductase heme-binding subunit YedZ